MTASTIVLLSILASGTAPKAEPMPPWKSLSLSERCSLAYEAVTGCANGDFRWCTVHSNVAKVRASSGGKLLVRFGVSRHGRKTGGEWLFADEESCSWDELALKKAVEKGAVELPPAYLMVYLRAVDRNTYRFEQQLVPTVPKPNTAVSMGYPIVEGTLRRDAGTWKAIPSKRLKVSHKQKPSKATPK